MASKTDILLYNSIMSTITAADVERDPIGFLRRVEAGETLVILRDNNPLAEIKPLQVAGPDLRPCGLCAGEFSVPDDFDSPLPDDLLREFEGR